MESFPPFEEIEIRDTVKERPEGNGEYAHAHTEGLAGNELPEDHCRYGDVRHIQQLLRE